jgi:hypothetical protein
VPGTRRWWWIWLGSSLLASLVLGLGIDFQVRAEGALVTTVRAWFAPAQVFAGHAQFGLQCVACHGDVAMAGRQAMQDKCIACHPRNDDNRAENSHPRQKFEDPSNIDRLRQIDALHCATCHGEHRPAAAHHVGLSIPRDFCRACHADVAKDAPSHAGMDYSSCSNAGCHSYHDNRGTYRKLLQKHVDKPEPPDGRRAVPARDFARLARQAGLPDNPHGRGRVGDCRPCHGVETSAFGRGKHGVRVASGLGAMRPELSPLKFRADVQDHALDCRSCHEADRPDTRRAAVAACLACHDDEHSRAYVGSRHEQAWQLEMAGQAEAGTGVSCATCHMPRHVVDLGDGERRVVVDHDNSANVRPAIKPARVCLRCHSLQFTHDALADRALARRNYKGRPGGHVASIEMEARRH